LEDLVEASAINIDSGIYQSRLLLEAHNQINGNQEPLSISKRTVETLGIRSGMALAVSLPMNKSIQVICVKPQRLKFSLDV
jgi:hypothetical protein